MNKIIEKLKPLKEIILFGFIILLIVFLIIAYSKPKTESEIIVLSPEDTPSLELPLKYFADSDVVSGSGVSDDKNDWDFATIEGGYQSFPTMKITLSTEDYSQKVESLPSVKSINEISKEDPEFWNNWEWKFKEQIKEYGDIATRFLPSYIITDLKKFDVDLDGKEETIISTCGTGGNHCPHKIIIVKDNDIIFFIFAGVVLSINKSETGNGFYAHWVPWGQEGTKWDTGMCCSPGYIKTRFVYENGKFKPVYEQEVLYFTVENTKK